MKKNKILKSIFATILACGGIIAAGTSLNVAPVGADLQVSTEDLLNRNSEAEKVSIRRAASSSELKVSKIYTQVGSDAEGASYLRFAAAVKGDINKLVYSADIEGSDYQIADKVVTSVYKSIVADGEKTYFTGNSLIDAELLSTKDYYWACFTIKYGVNSEFKNNKINVTLTANDGEQVLTRSESLNGKINGPSEYGLGDYYKDYKNQGIASNFTFEKINESAINPRVNDNEDFEITQSTCFDGEYIYVSMNAPGNANDTKNSCGYILKLDPTTGAEIARTKLIGDSVGNHEKGLGNANLFYNKKDGMIYSFGLVRAVGSGYTCLQQNEENARLISEFQWNDHPAYPCLSFFLYL